MTLAITLTLLLFTWQLPEAGPPPATLDRAEAEARTLQALAASSFDIANQAPSLEALWQEEPSITRAVLLSFVLCHPPARDIAEALRAPDQALAAAKEILANESIDPFLRAQSTVALAEDLLRARRTDEAATLLHQADRAQLAEPALYYFLLATAAVELSDWTDADQALLQLARQGTLPPRYAVTAEILKRTVAAQQSSPLATIANDMRDVRRRLEIGRTDQPVQKETESILKRLDDMIRDLENQESSSQQAQGSQAPQPSAPAPDSRPAGGQGAGDVEGKSAIARKSWGNLPAKEREKALQEIGRDLPGPYRAAVEEYFRRLARLPASEAP